MFEGKQIRLTQCLRLLCRSEQLSNRRSYGRRRAWEKRSYPYRTKGRILLDFCSKCVVPCGGISGAGLVELGMILVAILCGCAVDRIAFVKMAWSAETK